MVHVLTAFVCTLVIGNSISLAGVTYVSQTRAQAGHGTVVDIAPVPSPDGELAGLVLCDSSRARLTVLTPAFDTAYSIALERPASAVVAFRSADSDTLYFAAACPGNQSPTLCLVTSFENQTLAVSHSLPLPRTPGRRLAREIELSISYSSRRPVALVVSVVDVVEERLVTQGTLTELRSKTLVFDLTEGRFRSEADAGCVVLGDFDGDGHDDLAGSRDLWSRWGDESEPVPYVMSGVQIDVTTYHGGVLSRYRRENSRIHDLALLDLSPFVGSDELLVAGSGNDWLQNHSAAKDYLACYSYNLGRVEELWYQREAGFRYILPVLFHWQIAAVRHNDRLVLLEPNSGEATDSVVFDRPIEQIRFLTGSDHDRSLFLAGRVSDTVIFARVDREYRRLLRSEAPETELPVTFTLEQNYPNPFNGATQIRFTNKLGQHLSLRIYNVLGQEIATLFDHILPPGDFDYSWDATNSFGEIQGSGIYFAQLKSSSESHIIKLIYLK